MTKYDKTVLVIEDDKRLSKMLTFLFMANSYNVEIAENGLEALEVLKRMTPDVITLDLMMPVMDGFEFLEKIKENHILGNVPIIVVSAVSSSDTKERVLSMGAYDYLEKPFSSSDLVNKSIEAVESVRETTINKISKRNGNI